MKKIVLVDASVRLGGNSEAIIDQLSASLPKCQVTVFKMRQKRCRPCQACGTCQEKRNQACVQLDDLSELLALIKESDAVVLASPLYFSQLCSQARMFIERLYPLYSQPRSQNELVERKVALICSCAGGPIDIYEKYADWTVRLFGQVGFTSFASLVFNAILAPSQVKKREDYMDRLDRLACWLNE